MTVLYADDDKEDQEVFVEIIHAINPAINVISVEDGLKALEVLLAGAAPDIIFLDVNMPFLNGYQTLAEIRKNDKFTTTPVIIFSTNNYQPSASDYASFDARLIRKPNTLAEGIEALRPIIEGGSTNS